MKDAACVEERERVQQLPGDAEERSRRRVFAPGEEVIAVCRPDYFGARDLPRSAAELQGETLLRMDSPYLSWFSWPDWFARNGAPLTSEPRGPRFNNYSIAIQAALDGQGLALGWRRLIAPLLDEERLIQVTPARVIPDETYALLTPEPAGDDKRIRAFRNWILGEARRDWG